MAFVPHHTIEQSVVGIFWLDMQGRIYRASEAACRLLGYSKQELLNLTLPDFDPDYPLSQYGSLWEKIVRAGVLNFESRHRRKDGSTYPVEITTYFVTADHKGYGSKFFRDISKHGMPSYRSAFCN